MFDIDKLNKLEADENWKEAFDCLVDTWTYDKSYYFSLRFLFFCWHIYVYDHEMNFKEKIQIRNENGIITENIFDGISNNLVYKYLNQAAENIISNHIDSCDYVKNSLFAHMIWAQPYGINLDNREEFTKIILTEAHRHDSMNPIIKIQFKRFNRDWSETILSDDERNYIKNYFPSDSLFDKYFRCCFI